MRQTNKQVTKREKIEIDLEINEGIYLLMAEHLDEGMQQQLAALVCLLGQCNIAVPK
jgi:hypothetical protein